MIACQQRQRIGEQQDVVRILDEVSMQNRGFQREVMSISAGKDAIESRMYVCGPASNSARVWTCRDSDPIAAARVSAFF